MNPLTNMKNVLKLSEQELSGKNKTSWHDQYRDSAWIFFGGVPYDLTEGDLICVFSECGEVVNINLIRDKATGKSKGFGFLCYEDQRSTVLAVDNLNGIKILGRTFRVDHVEQYKVPNADTSKIDNVTAQVRLTGCAPALIKREPAQSVKAEVLPVDVQKVKVEDENKQLKKSKKSKKDKKEKKKKKKHKRSDSSSSEDDRRSKKKKRRQSDSSN